MICSVDAIPRTQKDLESEGYDRHNMDLPEGTVRLVAAVLDANPDAIIVTQSGSPINMEPWTSRAKTQIHMWVSADSRIPEDLIPRFRRSPHLNDQEADV